MEKEIVNRVANSDLIQVNLDEFYPKAERSLFDIKNLLKEGLVLVEKDFRSKLDEVDWEHYKEHYVGIICSVDAIVPLWAFMLVASKIKPYAKKVIFGDLSDLEKAIFTEIFSEYNFAQYQDKNVIVKGCGNHPIPESVFVDFSVRLQDYAKNIMFGEACSAVPIYKKKK